MAAKHPHVDSHRTRRLADKMRGRKEYRDSYVSSHTRQFLARQMREFRGDQSQTEFGAVIEKQQTVISRLEDPNYGKWTAQTLFEIASKLDVAVFIRFVDFPTFLKLTKDVSQSAIRPAEFDQSALDDAARGEEVASNGGALAEYLRGRPPAPDEGDGASKQIGDDIPEQQPSPWRQDKKSSIKNRDAA
jgi:hypothetical protein